MADKIAVLGHWTENIGGHGADRTEVVFFEPTATLADLLSYSVRFRQRLEIVGQTDAAKETQAADERDAKPILF